MSQLKIYQENQSDKIKLHSDLPLEIAELLSDDGIIYRQIPWQGNLEDILHQADLQRDLKREVVPLDRQHQFPFCSVSILDEHYPNYERLRLKYISEHTLDKDEIIYVLDGQMLLSIHGKQQVRQLHCQPGEMVMIPAGVAHWIDFGGLSQRLVIMRCTQQEQEPALHYTGSNIADLFPRLN